MNLNIFLEPKNYSLAQHAFIRALNIDHNSAISWSNLGTLYLIVNNIKLANAAFAQAQRADPNYMNGWIGQVSIELKIIVTDNSEKVRLIRG